MGGVLHRVHEDLEAFVQKLRVVPFATYGAQNPIAYVNVR